MMIFTTLTTLLTVILCLLNNEQLVNGFSTIIGSSSVFRNNNLMTTSNRIHRSSDYNRYQENKISNILSTKGDTNEEEKGPSILEQVASKGLAGVLAIALAESIFWALGMPLAAIFYKVTTDEWIDLTTADGQLKAAGFSFGYGGFATVILQYR